MNKKRISALILTAVMVLYTPVIAFADANDQESNAGNADGVKTEGTVSDRQDSTAGGQSSANNKVVSNMQNVPAQSSSTAGWESSDFTYTDMEKTLYGCDYSRQFNIEGRAVAGFSESGRVKVQTNKNLVIPARDTDGNMIVGVAANAFKKQGLDSVTFPTGMMTPYNDTVTHRVTKRGNFIIGDYAFASNNLKSVYLPEGVIAVMSGAFMSNKLTEVTFPKTIWWLETMSFANNSISKVNFPKTCDFQFEMHGMAFYKNQIKSVRLPDFTEVVNKSTFSGNPGMTSCPSDAPAKEQRLGGVVYMYTDNAELDFKDRIHTVDRQTESTKSWHQKLVVSNGTKENENPDKSGWNVSDFRIDGTVIKGLSASGAAKRAVNRNLVLPDRNASGSYITEIASATGEYGLFGVDGQGFESVSLPDELLKIGDGAFKNNGIKDISFPAEIEQIGAEAFAGNDLSSVVLPDTVTGLGKGAFSDNSDLERVDISAGMKEIPEDAFRCDPSAGGMKSFTSVSIPSNISSIGAGAFEGNNFSKIDIPSSVKSIGEYAFSTSKNFDTACTIELHEGLQSIGKCAFRNRKAAEIALPSTVKALPADVFSTENTQAAVTRVNVALKSQYGDTVNFPASEYHRLYLTDKGVWTADDFTYGETERTLVSASDPGDSISEKVWSVTGLSTQGSEKLAVNKNIVIPAKDPNGKTVNGIGDSAFENRNIESVSIPSGVTKAYSGAWNRDISSRGDFFIGAKAFSGNELKSLNIPDDVVYVGESAFAKNRLTTVKIPASVMMIMDGAFSDNEISSVSFPEKTDFPLQINDTAFGTNRIRSVQIPSNTVKMTKWAFLQNTGEEPVTGGTPAENAGGVVYVYKTDDSGAYLEDTTNGKSIVQKLIVGSIPAAEAPWCISDFTYDEAGTTITGLSNAGKTKLTGNRNLVLPDAGPDGKDIIGIGDGTYALGTFGVQSDTEKYFPDVISLPSRLQRIGKFAFTKSTAASIVLPDTLMQIDNSAFQGSGLKSVIIPDSVTTLGMGVFAGSTGLSTAVISKSLKEIPSGTFSMTSVSEADIPEGVTIIGDNAFSGTHIKKLSLPNTLETIGRNAFLNHQLSEVTIPANVKTIGNGAFEIFQEGLAPTLTKLTLNDGLQSIGSKTFAKSALSSVEIPDSLTSLNKRAFEGSGENVKLKTANREHLNETRTFFPVGTGHTVVYDRLSGTGWSAEDFTYNGSVLTGWSASGQAKRLKLRDLVLPDTAPDGTEITAVGDAAFKIPDNEITIMKFNVDSPNGMQSVVLPEKLKVIGKQAFEYNNFTEVDLADGLTSIGESAFHGNRLTKVSVPDSVTEMGMGAFAMNNITELKLSRNVTVIPQSAFAMNIRMEHIDIPDTVTEIGQMAFAGARLRSLKIPSSVTKIDTKAFHLHRITDLTIPGTVKEIGESAFEGTYKAQTLRSLSLGEGIQKIGRYAFKEGLLKEVRLPYSLVEMGEEPFLNNAGSGAGHVVILTTVNTDHMDFNRDKTDRIKFTGHNRMVKGNGNRWNRKTGGKLHFKSDGEFRDFRSVTVRGKNYSRTLSGDTDYTAVSGSIDITLAESYLQTLEPGTYTMSIEAKSGTATASFTVAEAPQQPAKTDKGTTAGHGSTSGTSKSENASAGGAKTGDSSMILFFAGMMIFAAVSLIFVRSKRD